MSGLAFTKFNQPVWDAVERVLQARPFATAPIFTAPDVAQHLTDYNHAYSPTMAASHAIRHAQTCGGVVALPHLAPRSASPRRYVLDAGYAEIPLGLRPHAVQWRKPVIATGLIPQWALDALVAWGAAVPDRYTPYAPGFGSDLHTSRQCLVAAGLLIPRGRRSGSGHVVSPYAWDILGALKADRPAPAAEPPSSAPVPVPGGPVPGVALDTVPVTAADVKAALRTLGALEDALALTGQMVTYNKTTKRLRALHRALSPTED